MKSSKPSKSPTVQAPQASSQDPLRRTQQIEDLMQLMGHATEKAVLFEIEDHPDCRVFVAGTFNNWDPTSDPLEYHTEDDVFRTTILLEAGTHEYKFVVDGEWLEDVNIPNWVLNDKGTHNSVICVHCQSAT